MGATEEGVRIIVIFYMPSGTLSDIEGNGLIVGELGNPTGIETIWNMNFRGKVHLLGAADDTSKCSKKARCGWISKTPAEKMSACSLVKLGSGLCIKCFGEPPRSIATPLTEDPIETFD